MKKRFLIAGLFISVVSFGQPAIKLYGYSRTHSPGTVRAKDPSASTTPPRKLVIDYYLFWGIDPSYKIQPSEAWLHGQRYKIKSVLPVHTPFYLPDSNFSIPKTSSKVLELKPDEKPAIDQNQPAWLKKVIKENEMVIIYTWKGKKYYKALKKIKRLEPVLGE